MNPLMTMSPASSMNERNAREYAPICRVRGTRRLAGEPLEERSLLAGVTLEGCTLLVEGTPEPDSIRVSGDGEQYVVEASFLDRPAEFNVFEVDSIRIRAGDGSDDLSVQLAIPPDPIRPVDACAGEVFRLQVDAGGGDNVIDLNVAGGVTPDDGRPAEFKPAEFHITSGSGADTFNASLTDVSGDVLIDANLEAGNDVVDLDIFGFNPQPEPPRLLVNLDGGAGNDVIDLNAVGSVTPDDGRPAEFHVGGGLGDDQINVGIEPLAGVDPVPFRLFVGGGGGADTIAVLAKVGQVSGVEPEPFLPEVSVLGGAGGESIRVGIEPLAGVEPTPFRLSVDGGGGADSIDVVAKAGQVSGVDPQPFIPDVSVMGGSGGDQIRVDFEAVAGIEPTPFRLAVDGGDGPDAIGVLAKIGQVSGIEPQPFLPDINVLGSRGSDLISVGIQPLAGVDPTPFRLFVDGGDDGDAIVVLSVAGSPRVGGAPRSSVEIQGGAGDDLIALVAIGRDDAFESLLVDGGPGFDLCLATANVSVINCELVRVIDDLFAQRGLLDERLH